MVCMLLKLCFVCTCVCVRVCVYVHACMHASVCACVACARVFQDIDDDAKGPHINRHAKNAPIRPNRPAPPAITNTTNKERQRACSASYAQYRRVVHSCRASRRRGGGGGSDSTAVLPPLRVFCTTLLYRLASGRDGGDSRGARNPPTAVAHGAPCKPAVQCSTACKLAE